MTMRMRYFWGGVLIVLGLLFLLQNLGILRIDIWGLVWALALIALGAYLVWGTLSARERSVGAEPGHVPLDGARIAHVRLEHGAGRMEIRAGAAPGDLLTGTFGGGSARACSGGDVAGAPAPKIFNWPGVIGPAATHRLDARADARPRAGARPADRRERQSSPHRPVRDGPAHRCGASSTHLRLPSGSGHTRRPHYGAASLALQVRAWRRASACAAR
jgi:hypothetical protein